MNIYEGTLYAIHWALGTLHLALLLKSIQSRESLGYGKDASK